MHSEEFLNNNYKKIVEFIKDDQTQFHFIIAEINKYFNLNIFIKKIKITEDNHIDLLTKLFSKSEINVKLFFIVIDLINNLKGEYKEKYCNEYKLFMILHLQDTINKWKALELLSFYSPEKNTKKHYETLRSQFERWCSKNIFKKAYLNLKPFENTLFNNNTTINDNKINDELYIIDPLKDYFIDSTHINNLRGSDNLIINPELKKKKVTKITEISAS
jgi:hypothetical protein